MTLAEFKKDKIGFMKEKNKEAVSALNLVINKIMLAEIEKKAQGETLSEGEILNILTKAEKELEEERDAFQKAGRGDSVIALNKQIETIKKYLPALMTEDEIKAEIEKLDDKSMPTVMKHFKLNFNGKCDMRLVGQILKSM